MLGRSHLWLLATVLILVSACAGSSSSELAGPQVSVNALPGFPMETGTMLGKVAPRRAQVVTSLGTWELVENSELDDPRLVSDIAVFKDAAYYFSPIAIQLRGIVKAPETPQGGTFFAFADFSSNTWRWQELQFPKPPGIQNEQNITIAFPQDINPFSPEGNIYIALAAYDQWVSFSEVNLIADEAVPPPLGLSATRGKVANAVTLTWADPAIAYSHKGGPDFTYDSIEVQNFDSATGSWETIAELYRGATEYTHLLSDPPPFEQLVYRVRTVVQEKLSRYSDEVTGWAGVKPIANLNVGGTAPTFILSGHGSYDPFLTNVITEYRYQVSYLGSSGWVDNIVRDTPAEFHYSLEDQTRLARFDLTVLDDEGLLSDPAENFFLWVPPDSDGVHPDPNSPQLGDAGTVQGEPGNYSLDIYLVIPDGVPPYTARVDTWFNGSFETTNGVPVVTVSLPEGPGIHHLVVDVPAGQPSGEYYMAVSVLDGDMEWPWWTGDWHVWSERIKLWP